MNNIIDILPLVLLGIFLVGCRPATSISSFNENYLSVDTGKYYRGLFAIVVVFNHLAQSTGIGVIFRHFGITGHLAVAVFFFLSGYGLQKQYISKTDSYRKGFLLKRIPSVLFPYIVITVVYWLMYCAIGQVYSLKDIIVAIIGGDPIVSNSWYIINLLVFYVAYWVLMVLCKKNYFAMILLAGVWYCFYVLFCYKINYGAYWYNASQLLVVGMFWATYEKSIVKFIKSAYFILAPVVWCCFLFLFLFYSRLPIWFPIPHLPSVLMLLLTVSFVLSVILFSIKVQIGNKVLGFLGDISLEIYISHGLFMTVLRNDLIDISNDVLWCAGVLTGSILFAIPLHKFFVILLNKYKTLIKKQVYRVLPP